MKEIRSIQIYYADGSMVTIDRYQLDSVAALADTVVLLETAKRVFDMLIPLFQGKTK